jgi:hypothetical protein
MRGAIVQQMQACVSSQPAHVQVPENGGQLASQKTRWQHHHADVSGRHLEYVPGRDELIMSDVLKQGMQLVL